jgi:hypothetical protein
MSLTRKNQGILKGLYIFLLLIPFVSPSVEITLLSIFGVQIIVLSTSRITISKSAIVSFSPLIVIAFISIFFLSIADPYEAIKDFFYIIKPIILALSGYILAKRICDNTYFIKAIIYSGLVLGISHIIPIIFNEYDVSFSNINYFRTVYGRDNYLELFSLLLLALHFKSNEIKLRIKEITLIVLAISVALYFSRTMLISLFVIGLSFYGLTRLTKKGAKYLSYFFVVLIILYSVLYSVEIKRNEGNAINKLLYKLKIAPAEIFLTEVDKNNHEELWDHWRGYEALMAIKSLEHNPRYWIFGRGLGSQVDLEFKAPLDEEGEGMQFISLLHNGYVYVLYKTGIIGLLLYLSFLYSLYNRRLVKGNSALNRTNNIIIAIGLFYAFSTLVIAGIYNPNDILMFVLGSFIYEGERLKKIIDEDSDNRH